MQGALRDVFAVKIMENEMDDRMDRTRVKISKVGDTESDFAFWKTQSYQARLSTLDQIRREYHGWQNDAPPRIQRVCRIVKRK